MKAPKGQDRMIQLKTSADTVSNIENAEEHGKQISPPAFSLSSDQSFTSKVERNFGPYKDHALEFMETTGTDLSGAQVIRDDSKLKQLDAKAATQGNKVIMKSSDDPSANQNKQTFMHEMVHVVQQSKGIDTESIDKYGNQINTDKGLEGEAENWKSFKPNVEAPLQSSSSSGAFQLKKNDKSEPSLSNQIFSKLHSSYEDLLDKRAVFRRQNFEAGKQTFTDSFIGMLDQFISKTGEVISAREYNEKYHDDSAKDQTEYLKKYHAVVSKFTHGIGLLSKVLRSSGDQIDNSIGSFDAFLTLLKDFIPDIPIIKHYLTFLFDGGKKILAAISGIKAKIADMNAVSRHLTGSDQKAMSNSDGSQQMLDYLNYQAFGKKDASAAQPVPEKVKEYIYRNQERLQYDINLKKNELPPDNSSNPFKWTTYNEKDLRGWIFHNKEAVYEKLTGFRKK